jgi:hypothetical protein
MNATLAVQFQIFRATGQMTRPRDNRDPGPCHGGRKVVVVFPFFGTTKAQTQGATMPSLFRFLTVVGVLGGLTFGAMFALANWFDPKPREITVSIPPDKFSKQR